MLQQLSKSAQPCARCGATHSLLPPYVLLAGATPMLTQQPSVSQQSGLQARLGYVSATLSRVLTAGGHVVGQLTLPRLSGRPGSLVQHRWMVRIISLTSSTWWVEHLAINTQSEHTSLAYPSAPLSSVLQRPSGANMLAAVSMLMVAASRVSSAAVTMPRCTCCLCSMPDTMAVADKELLHAVSMLMAGPA